MVEDIHFYVFYCLSLLRCIQWGYGICGVGKCNVVSIRLKKEYKICGGLIIQNTFLSLCCLTARFINNTRNNLLKGIFSISSGLCIIEPHKERNSKETCCETNWKSSWCQFPSEMYGDFSASVLMNCTLSLSNETCFTGGML